MPTTVYLEPEKQRFPSRVVWSALLDAKLRRHAHSRSTKSFTSVE
jgi:hypothetical protein